MTLHLPTFDEFFTNPQPCTAVKEVQDWLQSEEGIEWETRENLRQLGVWNNLGNQMVGAEDPEVMAA